MKLRHAIQDLDSKLSALQQIQIKEQDDLGRVLDKLNKIDEQTEKADASWDKSTLKAVKGIDKALGLAEKFVNLVKDDHKMCITITNNVEGMSMELVAQSSAEIHDKVSGKFVAAPDPFIPPTGITTMITESRKSALAGNVNGVIYLAKTPADERYHVVVSWSHPFKGKAHYFLKVEKDDKGCVAKEFLEDVCNTSYNAMLCRPERGTRVEGKDKLNIEAVGTFSDGFVKVTVQPRSPA